MEAWIETKATRKTTGKTEPAVKCSACNFFMIFSDYSYKEIANIYLFCPRCGEKMHGTRKVKLVK